MPKPENTETEVKLPESKEELDAYVQAAIKRAIDERLKGARSKTEALETALETLKAENETLKAEQGTVLDKAQRALKKLEDDHAKVRAERDSLMAANTERRLQDAIRAEVKAKYPNARGIDKIVDLTSRLFVPDGEDFVSRTSKDPIGKVLEGWFGDAENRAIFLPEPPVGPPAPGAPPGSPSGDWRGLSADRKMDVGLRMLGAPTEEKVVKAAGK